MLSIPHFSTAGLRALFVFSQGVLFLPIFLGSPHSDIFMDPLDARRRLNSSSIENDSLGRAVL